MKLGSEVLGVLVALGSFSFTTSTPLPAEPIKQRHSFHKQDGILYKRLAHSASNSTIDYVTNSGICETTPGVNQHSGYVSVGDNSHMWFWFFESRNNPQTAPLTLWFNGGPGCSGMIGLFDEHGPCRWKNDLDTEEPELNPYSFNTHSNIIYLDQPVGVGFSYGDANVSSALETASYTWVFLQAFYNAFPEYTSSHFAIFTESYGGHLGPQLAAYILEQNNAIASGTLAGTVIPLKVLGLNNAWVDPTLQYKSYIHYSATNKYLPFLSEEAAQNFTNTFEFQCATLLKACPEFKGDDDICHSAVDACVIQIQNPILFDVTDFNAYDIRTVDNRNRSTLPYQKYLARDDVTKTIGARRVFEECPYEVHERFLETGDGARSLLPTVSAILSNPANISVLLWAGDADWICNWLGVLSVAHSVDYVDADQFRERSLSKYLVEGVAGGEFKQAGQLAFLKVWGGGHEVMRYTPALALQAFTQMVLGERIESTSLNCVEGFFDKPISV